MKNVFRKEIRKTAAAALTVAMALTAALGGITIEAATTKTATLNNAQISFNDGSVQTVQTYLVNDYNYIRARDVSNGVNLEIRAIYNDDGYTLPGITIVPTAAATDTNALETLTQQTAQVTMQTCQINFGGYGIETEAFYLNDRYYFKLQDIAEASKKYEATRETQYQQLLATDVSDLVLPLTIKDGVRIDVEWSDTTREVSVNLVTTDYKAKLIAAKGLGDSIGNSGSNSSSTNFSDTTTTTNDKATTPTGALASSPENGTFAYQGISFGSDKSILIKELGTPQREITMNLTDKWMVYHDGDYNNFFMIFLSEDLVEGFYVLDVKFSGFSYNNEPYVINNENPSGITITKYKDSFLNNDVYAVVVYMSHISSGNATEGNNYLIYEITNAFRALHDVGALSWNNSLAQAIQTHAIDMDTNGFVGHTGSDGSTPTERAQRYGYSDSAGEICAKRSGLVFSYLNQWVNSEGHRNALLNPDYKAVGVGTSGQYGGQLLGGTL